MNGHSRSRSRSRSSFDSLGRWRGLAALRVNGRGRADRARRRPRRPEREQLRLGEEQRDAQDRRHVRRLRRGDLGRAPPVEEARDPRLLRREPEILHPHPAHHARGRAVRAIAEPPLRAGGVERANGGARHRVRVAERERRRWRRRAGLPRPAPRLERERAAHQRRAVLAEEPGDVGRRDEPLGQERRDELAASRGARALGADELLGREGRAPDEEPAELVLHRGRGGVLDGAAAEGERVARLTGREREAPVRLVRGGEQEQAQRTVAGEGSLAREARGDRRGSGDLSLGETVRRAGSGRRHGCGRGDGRGSRRRRRRGAARRRAVAGWDALEPRRRRVRRMLRPRPFPLPVPFAHRPARVPPSPGTRRRRRAARRRSRRASPPPSRPPGSAA